MNEMLREALQQTRYDLATRERKTAAIRRIFDEVMGTRHLHPESQPVQMLVELEQNNKLQCAALAELSAGGKWHEFNRLTDISNTYMPILEDHADGLKDPEKSEAEARAAWDRCL
jgi:hypothetical protein